MYWSIWNKSFCKSIVWVRKNELLFLNVEENKNSLKIHQRCPGNSKMMWPMRQLVAFGDDGKWRQKENEFLQVSLLFLSFLTQVACVVAMGTNLSKRNQWVKNKSENDDNQLNLPQCPTSPECNSVLLGKVREDMKVPPQRGICSAQLSLVCQDTQFVCSC